MRTLMTFVALVALAGGAQAQPRPASVAEVQARMAQLGRESSDRGSPQRSVQSFFLWLNNDQELVCLDQLVSELEKTPSRDAVKEQTKAIRDGFFTELPVKIMRRYEGETYDTCMKKRETYSYEIVGVEPTGTDKSVITLVAKNTTPLRPGMKPDKYDIERRRDGTRFRFTLVPQRGEWKISQVEEWETVLEEWSARFKQSDLDEFVPSLVMVTIL